MISDRDGVVEYVNQAFRDILQCENEDVIGKSVALIDPVMATSSWKRRFMYAIERNHIWHDEQWGVRKNGEKYLAKVTVTPLEMHEGEGISNFITIVRDQTSHHELQMQYYQAQKMEAVGTLVGGIAHDFNNMLSSMSGHVYIAKSQLNKALEKDTDAHGKVLQRLLKIDALGSHAATMIQQLMAFARKGNVEKTTLPLSSFMRDALQLAEVSLPANIDFQSEISHECIHVCANATQLQQVLMNVMNNARDALTGIAKPQIRVSLNTVDADYLRSHGLNISNQRYVEICVTDNGCGIATEDLQKITEPFFTTKAIGKGTGLGLSMVYGIVQDHHGYMNIISEMGAGTAIHIFLPLSKSDSRAPNQEKQLYYGHGETILLVDDQQEVRETYREVLESIGYDVLEACDGVEALEVYFSHADDIAAVVSDVVMPRMQGVELSSRIKQHNVDLPVLLMSGYDRDDVLADPACGVVDRVLSKPIAIDVFSHALYSMLEKSKVTVA